MSILRNKLKDNKSLKVLMIGNSFSICVGKNLPQMVSSFSDLDLTLCSAYIGGCSLERHCKEWDEQEKNPDSPSAKIYRLSLWHSNPAIQKQEWDGNVKEQLKLAKWDVVSIQQASHFSPFPETYQPWADKLVEHVKEFAPQAEIVIQQTWAYRSDNGKITPIQESEWGFLQDDMHEKLTVSYRKLAEHFSCSIIPTGLAVKLARENSDLHFSPATQEAKNALRWPDLPPQAGDPVGQYFWKKDEFGNLVIGADSIHLNLRGEYLQACVWFSSLFGISAEKISWINPQISDDDGRFLQKMAQHAVEEFPQI